MISNSTCILVNEEGQIGKLGLKWGENGGPPPGGNKQLYYVAVGLNYFFKYPCKLILAVKKKGRVKGF